MNRLILLVASLGAASASAQGPRQPDWARVEEETLRHFQALLRFDTTDPPGGEKPAGS